MIAFIAFNDLEGACHKFLSNIQMDISSVQKSSIEVVKFPIPHLVIDKIIQEDKLEIKDINIQISLSSLFSFNPEVTGITVGEVIIHLDNDDVSFLKHDEFISELIAKDTLLVQAKIKKLKFIESDWDIPLVVNNLNFHSSQDNTRFEGFIDAVGAVQGSFTKSDDIVKFSVDVNEEGEHFHLEEEYKNNLLTSGKVNMRTTKFINKIIKFAPDFYDKANYFNNNEEVNIGFDITSDDNALALKNIVIDSKSLQGKGNIALSKNETGITKIDFYIDKLDLFEWSNSSGEEELLPHNIIYIKNNKNEFSKNKFEANIFAKEIIMNANNILSNVSFKANVIDDKLKIQEFVGNIDENGKFKINGAVTRNSFRSVFEGRVIINHDNLNDPVECLTSKELRTDVPVPFVLSSDIKLSLVDLSFKNMLVKTSVGEVSGNLSVKYIGNTPRINSTIKFTYVDIDRGVCPVIVQSFGYIEDLFRDMKKDSYLEKFIPIRRVSSFSNHDITFDLLVLNNKIFENVNFNFSLSPGKASIEQLYIANNKEWVNTSFILDAKNIKPKLELIVHNGAMHTKFLSAQGMLNLKDLLLKDYDLAKIDLVVSGNLDNMQQGDLRFGRIVFVAKNEGDLLNITKFDADLFGGRLQLSGNVLFNPYTVNFAYAFNSARFDEIAKLLPEGLLPPSGAISARGVWSTKGNRVNELLYNLYSKSDIITKNIVINNLSLDNFIEKISAPNYNIESFNNDINRMLLTGKTQIDDLKSELEIDKGITTLKSMVFKTKYTSGAGGLNFNIYDFTIDANSVLSFYLPRVREDRRGNENIRTKMTINSQGNFFNPKKEAKTKELEELIKTRSGSK
jgi:hypothetical protein